MVDDDQDLKDQIRSLAKNLDSGTPITPEAARERAKASMATWNRNRRRRQLMVVAAVLILLAAAGLFVRASLAGTVPDDRVTAGRPIPRDLWELADRVNGLPPTTVLGENDYARFTYRRVIRSTDQPGSELTSDVVEVWVSIDGDGRQVTAPENNPTQTSEGPASPDVDGVPLRTFLALPDDIDAFVDAFADYGKTGFTPEVSRALVDVLSYTGLPAPARSGALRALDELGMVPVAEGDPGPNLLRVAGRRGPDGWRLQADFDVRTGMAVAWEFLGPDGEVTRFVTVEVDLRRDTQPR